MSGFTFLLKQQSHHVGYLRHSKTCFLHDHQFTEGRTRHASVGVVLCWVLCVSTSVPLSSRTHSPGLHMEGSGRSQETRLTHGGRDLSKVPAQSPNL